MVVKKLFALTLSCFLMKQALLLIEGFFFSPILLHVFSTVEMILYLAIAEFVWNEQCICGGYIAGCGLFSSWSRYKAKTSMIFSNITCLSVIFFCFNSENNQGENRDIFLNSSTIVTLRYEDGNGSGRENLSRGSSCHPRQMCFSVTDGDVNNLSFVKHICRSNDFL